MKNAEHEDRIREEFTKHAALFADGSFSIVTSRYSFHHLEAPQAVFAEMVRVCKPGGRIVVVDVAASDTRSKADAFNRMEKRRDPPHVRAMNLTELEGFLLAENLSVAKKGVYRIDFDVDSLLQGSLPADGDREGLRKVFRASVKSDDLGMNTREVDGKLWHY